MTGLRVVENFDVVEDISLRVASGRINAPTDALALEQLEEALGHSVVVTVATTTHAVDQVVVAQERLPLVASRLTALIEMNSDGRLRLATLKRHQHCIEHQTSVDTTAHRPVHHLPGEQVDHDCQIKLASDNYLERSTTTIVSG